MPSDGYLFAREKVGEAYEALIIARHYAPLAPIRTAERLVLETLVALYDLQNDPLLDVIDPPTTDDEQVF